MSWKYAGMPGMKNVNAASKPVDCPRCNKSIDVEVLHTGIIHDVKLTSQVIQKVESDEPNPG